MLHIQTTARLLGWSWQSAISKLCVVADRPVLPLLQSVIVSCEARANLLQICKRDDTACHMLGNDVKGLYSNALSFMNELLL